MPNVTLEHDQNEALDKLVNVKHSRKKKQQMKEIPGGGRCC